MGKKKKFNPRKIMEMINKAKPELKDSLMEIVDADKSFIKNISCEAVQDCKTGITCCNQQLKVLNGMLTQTQLEQGKLTLSEEYIDVYQLCMDQVKMVERTVKNGVKVECICDKDIYILGDDKHISQILTNLLSNASKITLEGKIILEIVKKKINKNLINIVFNVIDTGSGMSKDKIEKVLKAERFKHGGFKHGSGIGLCISIGIIKLLNSNLIITSPYYPDCVNKGTCFSFSADFLVCDKIKENDNELLEIPMNNILNGKTVVITDDQKMNHIILKKQLKIIVEDENTKLNIVDCYTGEECINYCKNNKVDIIIMDQVMESKMLLGDETNKEIRKFNQDVIIIHASGNCTQNDNIKYFQSGANHVWGKPIPFKRMKEDFINLTMNREYYKKND